MTEKHAIFRVDTRKSYTFKVAAMTIKGPGPFSPVLTINPDPEGTVGMLAVVGERGKRACLVRTS